MMKTTILQNIQAAWHCLMGTPVIFKASIDLSLEIDEDSGHIFKEFRTNDSSIHYHLICCSVNLIETGPQNKKETKT